MTENQNALHWADGAVRQRIAKGEKYSDRLVDEVMDDARREFNIVRGDRREMSDNERSRYAGSPRSSGPRSDGPQRGMKMTAVHKRAADAAFGYIEDETERHKKWAKEVGPSYVAAEKQESR